MLPETLLVPTNNYLAFMSGRSTRDELHIAAPRAHAVRTTTRIVRAAPRYRGTAFLKERINLKALKLLESCSRLACHCDALVFLF